MFEEMIDFPVDFQSFWSSRGVQGGDHTMGGGALGPRAPDHTYIYIYIYIDIYICF